MANDLKDTSETDRVKNEKYWNRGCEEVPAPPCSFSRPLCASLSPPQNRKDIVRSFDPTGYQEGIVRIT